MIELETPDFRDVPFGRGAWRVYGKPNNYPYYRWYVNLPRDGKTPNVNSWHFCVHNGIKAIQKLLVVAGYEQEMTGIYGLGTRRQIRDFQEQHDSLTAEGICGPMTAKELLRPVLSDAAARREVNPAIIAAFVTLESGWDPGAQGVTHSPDLSFYQNNVEDTDVAWEEAFDPIVASDLACQRYAAATVRYKGKGHDLRQACSIAQHNSPLWADQWFASGEAPNDTIAEYVKSVQDYIPAW